MPNQNIAIAFDSAKYEALKFFIEKQDMTIEQELSIHLDKLYQKNVPAAVREFVEREPQICNNQQAQTASETPSSGSDSESTSARRRPNRRSEQAATELIIGSAAQAEQTADEPEETQGMSLSM